MFKTITKLSCIALLFAAGISHAETITTPCNGFKINLKNSLPDDLLITKFDVKGAQIAPAGVQKIGGRTESTFTINGSVDGATMPATIVLNTLSVPSKKVVLDFNLVNSGLVCKHEAVEDKKKDDPNQLEATYTRLPGSITYTIK